MPHTIYTIRVEAYTAIGPGPPSPPVQVNNLDDNTVVVVNGGGVTVVVVAVVVVAVVVDVVVKEDQTNENVDRKDRIT